MVVGARDLHQLRPADRGAQPLGLPGGQNRRERGARNESGRLDPIEQGPGVDRFPGGVGRRVETVDPAPIALHHPLAGHVLEQFRVGHRLARQEPEGLDGLVDRGVVAEGALPSPVHQDESVVRDGRAGVDDHQAPHPLRVPGGKRHGVMTTHGVADDYHVGPGQGVHDGDEVAGEVLGGVAAIGRPVAEAMASLVEGHDVKPIREGPRYLVEPVGMGGATVEEAEGGAARRAPLEEVQGESVGADATAPRGRAGESMAGHAAIVRGARNFFALRKASE